MIRTAPLLQLVNAIRGSGGQKAVFIGHSTGGVQAIIAAARIEAAKPGMVTSVFTFGERRAGAA